MKDLPYAQCPPPKNQNDQTNSTPFAGNTDDAVLNDDVNYFNLETSPEGTALVFNASKRGLDSFLNSYGSLEFPPELISFVASSRPVRRWLSWEVKDNEDLSANDPSPYKGILNGYVYNDIMRSLYFQFLEGDDTESILSAGMGNGGPFLIVNGKGWQNFIKLLRCLRYKSYWFYATPPNPKFSERLPFQLTMPYLGHPEDHVFKALEFIRLEPDDKIFLETPPEATITGNNAGWLLFAQWMRNFANSQEMSKDICNQWNNLPEGLTYCPQEIQKKMPPTRLNLCKTGIDSSEIIISFNRKKADKTNVLYIYANYKGFKELAEVAEEYAFYADHDNFIERPQKVRCKGDVADGRIVLPDDLLALKGWEGVGGGLFSPKYNPLRFIGTDAHPSIYDTEFAIERNFVNERTLLTDDNT